MSKQSLSTLKSWFEDGQRPTGDQFSDVFDSFLHLDPSYDLTAPSASGVVATQEYVSNLIDGLDYKQEAFCSTTANITLSGIQNLDGTTGAADVRVLVQNQTTQTQNGIYLMKSGSWIRTADADSGLELQWAVIAVANGTTKGGKVFRCSVSNIVIGSTNIVWTEWSLASYTAGDGLALSGNQFAVDSTVVRTTGNQTLTGTKIFSSAIQVPSIQLLDSTYKQAIHVPVSGVLELGNAFSTLQINPSNINLLRSTNLMLGWEVMNFVSGGGNNSVDGFRVIHQSNITTTSPGTTTLFKVGNNASGLQVSSGSRGITNLAVEAFVNQTGTASGDMHMLHVRNPSITALLGMLYGARFSVNSATNVWNIYADGTASNFFKGDIIADNDIVTNNTKAFYLGDKNTDGTWRIRINTNDLIFERRVSGSYVQKGIFTA